MTLGINYSYYDDLESIKRSVPSFIDGVDLVFAIDGKYTGNPSPNDYSVEGRLTQLLTKINVVMIECRK